MGGAEKEVCLSPRPIEGVDFVVVKNGDWASNQLKNHESRCCHSRDGSDRRAGDARRQLRTFRNSPGNGGDEDYQGTVDFLKIQMEAARIKVE
jgi:hypothetical protein